LSNYLVLFCRESFGSRQVFRLIYLIQLLSGGERIEIQKCTREVDLFMVITLTLNNVQLIIELTRFVGSVLVPSRKSNFLMLRVAFNGVGLRARTLAVSSTLKPVENVVRSTTTSTTVSVMSSSLSSKGQCMMKPIQTMQMHSNSVPAEG